MAKFYGQLAGVPIQTLLSGVALASGARLAGSSADQVLWRDVVMTAGNVVGDVVSLGMFRASAFIDTVNSQVAYGAFGAGCTLSIGDASFPAGLRAALPIAAAGSTSMFAGPPAAQLVAPLWQRLGYASSPGGSIELLAAFGGANPANAPLAWQLFGRNL